MSEEAINILLIVITVVFSLSLISALLISYIYKRKHNLPVGECSNCHKSKSQLLKEYRSLYGKK